MIFSSSKYGSDVFIATIAEHYGQKHFNLISDQCSSRLNAGAGTEPFVGGVRFFT
ncbi:MAG: hypothetical protein CM15mP83_4830 [Flavobacteriaceae bacterium]|nr:MAG: hypothetical protein CM15mP83_4830 [Flavobacteriaceae bacterium]